MTTKSVSTNTAATPPGGPALLPDAVQAAKTVPVKLPTLTLTPAPAFGFPNQRVPSLNGKTISKDYYDGVSKMKKRGELVFANAGQISLSYPKMNSAEDPSRYCLLVVEEPGSQARVALSVFLPKDLISIVAGYDGRRILLQSPRNYFVDLRTNYLVASPPKALSEEETSRVLKPLPRLLEQHQSESPLVHTVAHNAHGLVAYGWLQAPKEQPSKKEPYRNIFIYQGSAAISLRRLEIISSEGPRSGLTYITSEGLTFTPGSGSKPSLINNAPAALVPWSADKAKS